MCEVLFHKIKQGSNANLFVSSMLNYFGIHLNLTQTGKETHENPTVMHKVLSFWFSCHSKLRH